MRKSARCVVQLRLHHPPPESRNKTHTHTYIEAERPKKLNETRRECVTLKPLAARRSRAMPAMCANKVLTPFTFLHYFKLCRTPRPGVCPCVSVCVFVCGVSCALSTRGPMGRGGGGGGHRHDNCTAPLRMFSHTIHAPVSAGGVFGLGGRKKRQGLRVSPKCTHQKKTNGSHAVLALLCAAHSCVIEYFLYASCLHCVGVLAM